MSTVIILGGSSSIGKAICNQFNTQDNKLISTYCLKGDASKNPKNAKSFWLDLKILFLTFKKVLFKDGVSPDNEEFMPRFDHQDE